MDLSLSWSNRRARARKPVATIRAAYFSGGPLRREEVAGELLAEELVVGLVAVEGVDHPVAVPPGVRQRVVAVLAGGVGVADEVEPVPAPALAVGGEASSRSTTFAKASGESSFRNASTSSGVGGRPVRS